MFFDILSKKIHSVRVKHSDASLLTDAGWEFCPSNKNRRFGAGGQKAFRPTKPPTANTSSCQDQGTGGSRADPRKAFSLIALAPIVLFLPVSYLLSLLLCCVCVYVFFLNFINFYSFCYWWVWLTTVKHFIFRMRTTHWDSKLKIWVEDWGPWR